jgi:Mg-chelatase subunit ChlD
VRIVAGSHPLSGQLLRARHVYRRYGRIWLVVVLADGGVCSVPVEDTDALSASPVVTPRVGGTVVSIDGARGLLELVHALRERTLSGIGVDGPR